jgi:hypothetical protein
VAVAHTPAIARCGLVDVSIEFTHAVGDGVHAAIVRATKPAPTER